jgi:hypothetical protein
MKLPARLLSIATSCLTLLIFDQPNTWAGSATWNLNPSTNSWTTALNWTPATVPNGSSDVASFGVSNTPGISLAAPTSEPLTLTLDSAVFNPGASNFTISVEKGLSSTQLAYVGAGIVNNSSTYQQFTVAGTPGGIVFSNGANAGYACYYTVRGSTPTDLEAASQITFEDNSYADYIFLTNEGSASAASGNLGGATIFLGNSNAGDSSLSNNGAQVVGGMGGYILFSGVGGNAPSAGNAYVENLGGDVAGAAGGLTVFEGTATLGNGSVSAYAGVTANSLGGTVIFKDQATAADGFLGGGRLIGSVGLPGQIFFQDDATGGTADCFVFEGVILDISQRNPPGITVGVFAGGGIVNLGSNNLTTGVPNVFSSFTGTIQDGGVAGGVGGSFTCGGSVTLSGVSTYTGGTIVDGGGYLNLAAPTGSAVGTGPVQIFNGTLAGTGRIPNSVVVGTGSSANATLDPQFTGTHTLSIRKNLLFRGDAILTIRLNARPPVGTRVVARGVRIESGGVINVLSLAGNHALPIGTVYSVLENTFTQPIIGTFANLPDGGIITVGTDKLQANYSGGDGNDLTLTVVP